jgi:hypothetical protein
VARTHELYLRVREADEADYGKWLIRIHEKHKPEDLEWGDQVDISLDKKHWISCQLERAGSIGAGKIYIDIPQRGELNKDTRIQIARVNEPCQFYIRKASSWKKPLYIVMGFAGVILIAYLVYAFAFAGR